MSSASPESDSSYYTTAIGENGSLDGFSVEVSEHSNITTTPYMLPAYFRTTSMIVCIIIMALGIVGNLMVPLVVFRGKDMRNSTNIFLVNLSIADLCVLLICTPTVLVEVNSGPQVWPLGEHMCKIVPFVELTVAHASVLTILAISFERYYAICEPLRAGYVCTKANAIFLCVMAWLMAALCTSPILLVTSYDIGERPDGSPWPECNMMADNVWKITFFLTIIAVFFVVPLVILVVLYSVIACHLMANPAISRGPANNLLKYRKQVVLMLGTVVLCFFFCLIPFRAFTVWIILFATPDSIRALGVESFFSLLYFCRFMLYLNSAINPILYNLMSTKFRDGFRKLCCFRGGRRRWNSRKLQRKKRSTTTTTTTGSSSRRTGTSTSYTYTTTGSTNCSSNQSDSGTKRNSNKNVKLPELQPTVLMDKQSKLPLLSTVTDTINGKKKESYV